jgi:hypothetical protein
VTTSDYKRAFSTPIAVGAVLAALLVLPGHALAANDCSNAATDPTAAQYCNPTKNAVKPVSEEATRETETSEGAAPLASSGEGPGSSGEAKPTSTVSSSLPFTGTDLLALLAVASAFVAIGLALRRLSSVRPGSD